MSQPRANYAEHQAAKRKAWLQVAHGHLRKVAYALREAADASPAAGRDELLAEVGALRSLHAWLTKETHENPDA